MKDNQNKVLIFAGTVDGRKMAEYLLKYHVTVYISVATEYGESLVSKEKGLEILTGRLSAEEMEELMVKLRISSVIDGTHPYAKEVTENIKRACEKTGIEYLRLLRKNSEVENDIIYVSSTKEAAEYLKDHEGRALLTTGSKELKEFTIIPEYDTRLFPRVLSIPEVVEACKKLGFQGRNLICMQGPFSEELNYAMLKQIDATFLVTKESGQTGGFLEKIWAARRAGVTSLVIGRPMEESGLDVFSLKKHLIQKLNLQIKRKISIVGIGMGGSLQMTEESRKICEDADLIIGAQRMVESYEDKGYAIYKSYQASDIKGYLWEHPEYENVVILQSGDVGFYSGTKQLLTEFKDEDVILYPGISSVSYFCAKIRVPWQNVKLISLHGREENIVEEILRHQYVYSLLGSTFGLHDLCEQLLHYGLKDVLIYAGENLSYQNEKIISGSPSQLLKEEFSSLSVVLIKNIHYKKRTDLWGIKDEAFLRDKIPMTKREIRMLSVGLLMPEEDSIIYDIGAGTGSVSIELARWAYGGRVYAIERKKEAVELIERNKMRFQTSNLQVIPGLAPEALRSLPAPSHVFIGGSGGNLKEIIHTIYKKNRFAKIVIHAITLETVSECIELIKTIEDVESEIICVNIAKAKEVSRYHMMMGQNPVYMITLERLGE